MKKLSKIQENINLLKQKMAANAKGNKKSGREFCLKDRNVTRYLFFIFRVRRKTCWSEAKQRDTRQSL